MKSPKQILENDRNPSEELLKVEFKQKLQGKLTHRQIRQAMLHVTNAPQLVQLITLAEELEGE